MQIKIKQKIVGVNFYKGKGRYIMGINIVHRFMKRIKLFICVIGMIVLLCACGVSDNSLMKSTREEKEIENVKNTSESREDNGFFLRISTNRKEKVIIPDPAKVTGISEVVIYQNEKNLDIDDMKRSKNIDDGEEPLVDVSFLGIKEKVYVTNCAVGKMGEKESEEITVNYGDSKSQERKLIRGNCLVLTLNKESTDEDADNRAYLAVLDYKCGKQYLIRTGLQSSTLNQLNLCDFTGDGQDEMIVSGIANNWMEWQMFKLMDNDLEEIRSDFYEDDEYSSTNYICNAFESKVILPNKIKITGKGFDFEKIISVDKFMDTRDLENEDVDICGEAGEIYGYDYFDKVDSKTGICIKLDVSLYGSDVCGKIDVYLKYNKETEKIDIDNVEFKK